MMRGCEQSSVRLVTDMPFNLQYDSSCSQTGTINAAGNLRSAPINTTWFTKRDALIACSIGCGAMYLPPEVLNNSFLRSVMHKNPSLSIAPTSPVLNHPSLVNTARVSSGLL